MKKSFLPILFFGQISFAQTSLWSDFNLSKKWNKQQQTSFDIGERQNLGVGFDRIYMELSHQYEVYDGIKIGAAYRMSLNEKGDQLKLKSNLLSNRYQLAIKLSLLDLLDIGPKRLDLSWSSTQQFGFQVNKRMSSIWRNKISIDYDIKNFPLTPMFSAEHFYRWNADVIYTPTDVLLDGATVQWRFFIGTQVELPKKQNIKLQYGLRMRSSGIQPILRAAYSIQF